MAGGFGRRLAAYVLDRIFAGLVFLTLCAGVLVPIEELIGHDPGSAAFEALPERLAGSVIGLWMLTHLGYFLWFGVGGETPGKVLLGIRVCGPGGGPPGSARALAREVAGRFLCALPLCLGYFWALGGGRCWHDMLVGTDVVVATPLPKPEREGSMVEYAGFGRRLGASLVDGLVVGVLTGIASLFFGDPFAAYAVAGLGSLAYYVLFVGIRGQTPGKMALGLRVVGPGGTPPGVARAFLREVVGKFLSSLVLCLGYLWMLWDDRRECWQDKLAGTVVVRTREVVAASGTGAMGSSTSGTDRATGDRVSGDHRQESITSVSN